MTSPPLRLPNGDLADLKGARALIADPAHWIKGFFAKSAKGNPVLVTSKLAVCFCAIGAVRRTAPVSGHMLIASAMADWLPPGWYDVAVYQDARETTHADVLALFDRCIAFQETQGDRRSVVSGKYNPEFLYGTGIQ